MIFNHPPNVKSYSRFISPLDINYKKFFLNTCLAPGLGTVASVTYFNTSGPPNSVTVIQRIFINSTSEKKKKNQISNQ